MDNTPSTLPPFTPFGGVQEEGDDAGTDSLSWKRSTSHLESPLSPQKQDALSKQAGQRQAPEYEEVLASITENTASLAARSIAAELGHGPDGPARADDEGVADPEAQPPQAALEEEGESSGAERAAVESSEDALQENQQQSAALEVDLPPPALPLQPLNPKP